MLCLTRKLGQKIRVGNDIIITVTKLRSGDVQLGIDAPKDISVMRDEVIGREPKQRQQQPLPPTFSPPTVMGFSLHGAA